jgi:hypothetical protein
MSRGAFRNHPTVSSLILVLRESSPNFTTRNPICMVC